MGDGNDPAGDDVDLSPAERGDIDGMYLRIANSNFYELLGVPRSSDRRAIREAYFAHSKRFHPDMYFGRKLGPWKARTEAIFREVTRAYETLSNRSLRADYDASIGGRTSSTGARSAVSARSVRPPAPPAPPAPTRSPTGSSSTLPASPVITPAPPARGVSQSHMPAVHPRPATQPPPAVTESSEDSAYRTDPESAKRAAREAIARRFSARPPGGGPVPVRPSGTMPAPSSPPGAAGSTSLDSLRVQFFSRQDAERSQKLGGLIRMADEAEKANNILEAANLLNLALQLAPDDVTLRARTEAATKRMAESMADTFIQQARSEEQGGRWDRAAEGWLKASLGRPKDASLLERAANALMRGGTDLRKAADLARRATALEPKNVKFHVTLGQVFLAAGLKASASAALEAASALDPGSPVVKDLLAKAKA